MITKTLIETLFTKNNTLSSNKIKKLKENYNFSIEDLYNIYYDNPSHVCQNENCQNNTKFMNFTKGYRKFCSNRCHLTSKQSKEKIEKTCLEKYGVDNISKCDYGLELIKTGFQKKYGVDNIFQTENIILNTKERQTLTTEQYIKKANKVHNNKYDYSKVDYINSKTKIIITCHEHGDWETRPDNHINANSGCPICALLKTDYEKYKNQKTSLYYIYLPQYDLYKIGITKSNVEKRFSKDIKNNIQIITLNETIFEDGIEALEIEQLILKRYKNHRYTGKNILEAGNSELFTKNILNS